MRVTLGEDGVDCRPSYRADPGDWIVKAIVAAEDGLFWRHCGVRPLSAARAAFQNAVRRRRVSGASTITMQTVRLIHPHPKTLWWKCKEAMMAVKMERARDKRWILSQYLNRVPCGSNFVGIEAAANGWFGKSAKQLGLGEAALLAGMVQAPGRFRPDRHLDRALARRDYVLARMERLGMITAEQADGARSVRPEVCRAPRPFRHPHYCDWALRALGPAAAGGDVTTALDEDIQAVCESAARHAAEDGGRSAAVVVMRVDTSEVVALACSGDYFNDPEGQVNTATASRPAGSTLKPFLMAHAMDRGLVAPEERLADVPTVYRGYRPTNFDARHRGLVTARDALVLSLNIPFVRLLEKTGLEEFGETLAALGMARAGAADEDPGLGLAIGNAEVTLLELAAAYAAVARGGTYLPPRAAPGAATGAGDRVFSEGASFIVSDMLSGDERSAAALGHVADVAAPKFAWKTGTSAAYRDAWTVAWNPRYVVGAWCGHLHGGFGDQTIVGAKAAAPLAWRVARALQPRGDSPWFATPEEVVSCRICSLTGLPASADCPHTETGRALSGRSGARLCRAHRRGLDGNPVEIADARVAAFAGGGTAAAKVEISRPAANTKFILMPGEHEKTVVCRVIGNPPGARLWWFVGGAPAGASTGTHPFTLVLTPGSHEISCATAEGDYSSISVSVESPATFAATSRRDISFPN